MGLFSSSKSSSVSTTNNNQVGTEGSGNVALTGGTFTNNFPDAAERLVSKSLELSGNLLAANTAGYKENSQLLGTIAQQTKSPESAYLPFVVALGAVAVAYFVWGKK